MGRQTDIVIFGAGIAGLWLFHRLRRAGYDALLLESAVIGGGQSIASQGILHSGLKYALAGRVNALARSISAMPERWRAALRGEGEVDLSTARLCSDSQLLLIPPGLTGGVVKSLTSGLLGRGTRDVPPGEALEALGFQGNALFMGEPVLDVPSVVRALAGPYLDAICGIDTPEDPFGFLARHGIEAGAIVFTAAGSNHRIARAARHDEGLKTQARPLLMGMLRNAPCPLYAHLVGASDKPVATITTHEAADGALVWYVGGQVAERAKDCAPNEVYAAMEAAFARYLPGLDVSGMEWAVLPVDRVEGASHVKGRMPDTPVIHSCGNAHYCWPTKLTFAPLLADRVMEKLADVRPSGTVSDWSFLPGVDFARAPWDKAQWTQ